MSDAISYLTPEEHQHVPLNRAAWARTWNMAAAIVACRDGWVSTATVVLALGSYWSGVVNPQAPIELQGNFFPAWSRWIDMAVLALFLVLPLMAACMALVSAFWASRSTRAWAKGVIAAAPEIANQHGVSTSRGMLCAVYGCMSLWATPDPLEGQSWAQAILWCGGFVMLTAWLLDSRWLPVTRVEDSMVYAPPSAPHIAQVSPKPIAADTAQLELDVNHRRGTLQATERRDDEAYPVPVEARKSHLRFSHVMGMESLKSRLRTVADEILTTREGSRTRNGILLHGESGNGKTLFAEALAGELNLPLIHMTPGRFATMWIGQMSRTISRTFDYARSQAPCVLFMDELDSFVKSRASGSPFRREDDDVTNTLLTEITALRGTGVVLIGATNHLDKLDTAGIREGRFDFKIEITPPDEAARIGLLQGLARRMFKTVPVVQADLERVARRWDGFSVARLQAVASAVRDQHRQCPLSAVSFDTWVQALRSVQGAAGKVPTHALTLDQLVLDATLGAAVRSVVMRLKQTVAFEEQGGTLPRGLLFYGPPGTGKTATAMTIARESGWAFLSTSGPELIGRPDRLEALLRQARDLRPALIFIDEADSVLADRSMGTSPETVQTLLTLMDGARNRCADVVWIAATNRRDIIDPALLRAGRFSEKLAFSAPSPEAIHQHVQAWLSQRRVAVQAEVSLAALHALFEGQALANVNGVLEQALNRAIEEQLGQPNPPAPALAARHLLAAAVTVLEAELPDTALQPNPQRSLFDDAAHRTG